MTNFKVLILTLAVSVAARADFSYTMTRKGAGPSAKSADEPTRHFLKGQKMMIDSGRSIIIMDFDAGTMTSINKAQQTYSVKKFSDMGQGSPLSGADIKTDIKETGLHRNINGFEASEVIMTMEIENAQSQKAGMKMQMEMDIWVSPDVPGSQELRAFYQRNANHFPWAAMGAGGDPRMQKSMAELQRKLAGLKGVPVLQITRMKAAGNEAQNAQMQQSMEKARAQLEELQKKGGPQAAAAAQALARMGAASGSGSLFEMSMESSNFSISPIPDSAFAIPAGYKKVD